MNPVLDELVALLALERIEDNLFRGQSQDLGWGRVFGGQVLGQALSAAQQTVPKSRPVHSLHGYFLLSGDVSKPIVYEVDRSRDGGTFTTRRVVAIQNGRAIFNLAASFQEEEQGFEHQDPMPDAPPPESVPREDEVMADFVQKLPKLLAERFRARRPFEIRQVAQSPDPILPPIAAPARQVWIKADGELPDDPALHACLLAYVSDYNFLGTALMPHGSTWLSPGMQMASLDHTMWFHARARADRWMLHGMDSPRARGGRGLVRGSVFGDDGVLIASTAQEGLIRQRSTAP